MSWFKNCLKWLSWYKETRASFLFHKGFNAYNRGEFQSARDAYAACADKAQTLVDEGHTEFRPDLAKTRVNLAVCLYSLGELALARTTFETTLNDYESLVEHGHFELTPDLAKTRMNLAVCLADLGELALARTTYEITLNDYESLIAQGRVELQPDLALIRMNLATCLQNVGELALARTTYETTLNDYESLIAQGRLELRPKLAATRMNLASCLAGIGELTLARMTYRTTLNDYESLIAQGQVELRPKLAATRLSLGLAISLDSPDEVALARMHYEAALNDYENLIAQGQVELRPDLAMTRMNLANCLWNLGDLSLARTTYETTLNEYENLIDQGKVDLLPDLAMTRINLASCLVGIGELALARTAYETTLNEYESLIEQGHVDVELRRELAGTRMGLANCLFSLGDFALAQTTYEATLNDYESLITQGQVELFRPNLITRINLASCLARIGELALARTIYEATLNEYENLIEQGHVELRRDLAGTRMNLAVCLDSLGESVLARTAYETTLNEYESLIDQGRVELQPDLAITHANLTICLKGVDDFPATETQYHESFHLLTTLQKLGQLFPDAIKIILWIADWHRHPKRPPHPDKPKALELAQLGLDWLDELLNRLSDAATNFMLNQNLPLFWLATELALELNKPEQAYLILERSKSRVLVEQMLRERAEPGSHVDENLRTQYRELRAKLRSLVNQLGTSAPTGMAGDNTTRFFTPTTRSIERPPEQTEQLWQEQQAVEQELDKVRRAITEQDAAFGEAIQPRALTVEEVIALIPADTLVIAFEQGPDFLRLYAITAQGIPTPLQIDLSSQQVNERVEAFKNKMAIEKDEEGKKLPNLSKLEIRETELTDIIHWLDSHLKPAFTKLIAQVKPAHIVLIPHVSWHLLPIHLVSVEDEPLTVRYPIHYLPSLQILRLISERPPANQGKGCIIANPWSPELEKLLGKKHELKSAEQEGYKVYELRAQVDQLLAREQATSTAVRQALDKTQHSHFSCHGHFDADLTKAGLILADCKDLAAIEMFTSIRMDNPRLVVMSACETAQIKATLADEYMGLSSSFLFAGTHNVLSTLWRVDDNASRLLIEDFYQGLNDGLSAVNALQKAQRHLSQMTDEELCERLQIPMIATSSEDFSNPYYWAGFVLIGDGE